ncbi:MAG: hypothetical protein HYV14_04725 [Elusimicrobia bacterium]|nr:hypothetical protein [Elusimicrobiota bacterium]
MKMTSLLGAVLLLAPALASAADAASPPPPSVPSPSAAASGAATRQALRNSIGGLNAAFDSTQQCLDLEAELKSDLAKKKAALAAEFKGSIPLAFDDLLRQKTQRIEKQHARCFREHDALGKQIETVGQLFGSIEPKSLNVKTERELFDAKKARFLEMMPTAKPYNRPKRRQASE